MSEKHPGKKQEQAEEQEVKQEEVQEAGAQTPLRSEAEHAIPESSASLSSQLGSIRISDSIVAKIAGLAAIDVEGVAGMSAGKGLGLAEAFSRKNVARGVKVEVDEKETSINLYLIMKYGVHIADVSRKVQQKVKASVEHLTGLKVLEVNVFVQGVQLPPAENRERKKS